MRKNYKVVYKVEFLFGGRWGFIDSKDSYESEDSAEEYASLVLNASDYDYARVCKVITRS